MAGGRPTAVVVSAFPYDNMVEPYTDRVVMEMRGPWPPTGLEDVLLLQPVTMPTP